VDFDAVNNQGVAVTRRGHINARVTRRVDEYADVQSVVGPLTPGVELFAVSAGRFSLAAVIAHAVDATGPADVWLCVPGVAAADLGTIHALTNSGTIRTLRLLVDFQVAARQPALVDLVRLAWGPDALRVGHVHTGFVVIRNDAWSVSIRTSAGLNASHRMETIEVSDNVALADFLVELFNRVSTNAAPHDATRVEHNAAHERAFPRSVTASSPTPGDNDARRPGVSYR
jgi:hypothetical protein